MREADVRERAFAMPLTSPAYPPGPYRFIDREYEIPLSMIPQAKPKVTVRFQATGGNDIATVFGLRVVRR